MASYVPPHKRHSNDSEKPTLSPALFVPEFKKKLNLGSSSRDANKGWKIIYADGAVRRWFALGVDDDGKIPSNVDLQPVPVESIERRARTRTGEKPLALVNNHSAESYEKVPQLQSSPWEFIADSIWSDLLSSYDIVRREVDSNNSERVRSNLVARFGKVLFQRDRSDRLRTSGCSFLSERTLGQLKRSFYTNIPIQYVENIVDSVMPEIGAVFEEEKDIYHVKLSDNTRPDATISCKCSVNKDDGKLEFYKIELNQVRQLVVDISCLQKDLDLRLMLCTKKIVRTLTDEEENSIRSLVNSAILDPNVKGGLRWPLGKASSGDRFMVVGIWHTVSRTYCSSSLRLRVRQADRYDFRTATGETSREVSLKLKGVMRELKEKKLDANPISEALKDGLKFLWEHFLDCSHFLK